MESLTVVFQIHSGKSKLEEEWTIMDQICYFRWEIAISIDTDGSLTIEKSLAEIWDHERNMLIRTPFGFKHFKWRINIYLISRNVFVTWYHIYSCFESMISEIICNKVPGHENFPGNQKTNQLSNDTNDQLSLKRPKLGRYNRFSWRRLTSI